MEAIVTRALTKIVADCSRKQTALKASCKEALAVIEEEQRERREDAPRDDDANKYMPILLAACESQTGDRTGKLVVTALDAIVKLIDFGYIRDVELESDDEDEPGEDPSLHEDEKDQGLVVGQG
ncbi:unnamed protein product, partial [Discosporangium mesarthrocarpum]